MTSETSTDNNNLNITHLLCPLCHSSLTLKSINKVQFIIVCSGEKCLFPMNTLEMKNYIYNPMEMNKTIFLKKIKQNLSYSASSSTDYSDNIKEFKEINEKNNFSIDNKEIIKININNKFKDINKKCASDDNNDEEKSNNNDLIFRNDSYSSINDYDNYSESSQFF